MKKLLFGAAALLMIASCSNSGKSEINTDAPPQDNEMQNSESTVEAATPEETTVEVATPKETTVAVDPANSVSQETATQKEPVTILTFCHWDSSDKAMTFLAGTKVFDKLKKLGFVKKREKLVWQGESDSSGVYMKIKKRVYELDENGKVFSIELEYNDLDRTKWMKEAKISFPTSEEAEAFVRTAARNHYKKVSNKLYRGCPTDVFTLGTEIKVNGNVVEIEFACGE